MDFILQQATKYTSEMFDGLCAIGVDVQVSGGGFLGMRILEHEMRVVPFSVIEVKDSPIRWVNLVACYSPGEEIGEEVDLLIELDTWYQIII